MLRELRCRLKELFFLVVDKILEAACFKVEGIVEIIMIFFC
jgi:hypothetical protein